MELLGAHVSVAGGLPRAFPRGDEMGCTTLQIFVKNASQWRGRELDEAEIVAFREARQESSSRHVVAHAAYLINLAASEDGILERSRRGLADELDRCRRLGIEGLVVHPGAHLGAGEEDGLAMAARSLRWVLERTDPGSTRILLESTAGQGTVLGHRLEHLERLVELTGAPSSLGICLDTCHLFAAGYPLGGRDDVEQLLAEVVARFGAERLGGAHLNDSRHPAGSRKDRHANIGEGKIGEAAFAALLRHPLLVSVPMIVETPLGEDKQGHARDLERLRRLAPQG
jgi:deoxyribonuclease IV